MTIQELQQNHPDLYAQVFGAGVKSERLRVNNWLVYSTADPEKVNAGIKGTDTVESSREELLVKMHSSAHIQNLEKDSKGDIRVPESSGAPATEKDAEQKAFDQEMDELFKTA